MATHERLATGPSEVPPASIKLVNYPVQLGHRQQEHSDALLRELSLLVIGRGLPGHLLQAPIRLLEMVDMLVTVYSAELDGVTRQRQQAYARGDRTTELTYPNLPEGRTIVERYADIAVEVDEFCRNGDLLTLATPPDLLELRAWTLGEFLRQMDGQSPTPWAGPLD